MKQFGQGRPCNGLWATGQLGTRAQTLQRLKKNMTMIMIMIMNTTMMYMNKMKKNMTVIMMSITIMIMFRAEKNQGNRTGWSRTRNITGNSELEIRVKKTAFERLVPCNFFNYIFTFSGLRIVFTFSS
jgi:hypothetical protein